MLRLYLALTVVQEAAYLANPPPPLAGGTQGIYPSPARGGGQGGGIASLAVEHVMPGVIDATVEVGPRTLRDGVIAVYASANLEDRSEEHTSELQSRLHLVCRLLLEKKKRPPNTPSRVRHFRFADRLVGVLSEKSRFLADVESFALCLRPAFRRPVRGPPVAHD